MISYVKQTQKKCSTIWNWGGASRSIVALFASVSMAIQIALSSINSKAACSNRGCLANH
eukprot:CAMPEP_0172795470 /NCGR_PEP_ID=MMETSP1074-20121228/210501_1 /TAXON_ID=2916 /ORGANISM="Ceratium fusus, Strain PA161109" /LENGTH=58 /DNA_ID=CAMNT_0013632557 /DNA_START=396 /DNA_END=572 /DNA_ORIENTATION=+